MENCIFCKIAAGGIPSDIVYEDGELLAFKDISPKAPVHILIIPKQHIPALSAVDEDDIGLLGRANVLAARIAKEQGIDTSGFRVLTNSGPDSGQVVHHLHFHLIGGCCLGDICFV